MPIGAQTPDGAEKPNPTQTPNRAETPNDVETPNRAETRTCTETLHSWTAFANLTAYHVKRIAGKVSNNTSMLVCLIQPASHCGGLLCWCIGKHLIKVGKAKRYRLKEAAGHKRHPTVQVSDVCGHGASPELPNAHFLSQDRTQRGGYVPFPGLAGGEAERGGPGQASRGAWLGLAVKPRQRASARRGGQAARLHPPGISNAWVFKTLCPCLNEVSTRNSICHKPGRVCGRSTNHIPKLIHTAFRDTCFATFGATVGRLFRAHV